MICELDTKYLRHKIDILSYQEKVNEIDKTIKNGTGAGADFLGWYDWPLNYDKEELAQIKEDAKYVRDNYEVLVVCGIGGSYLGARAAIEALNGLYGQDGVEIIFMGQTLDPTYIKQVVSYLKGKKFAINVISKSGTTTETSISFRLLKELLEKEIGLEMARKSIFATTDKENGALLKLSKQEGYRTYVLPANIGGRYSVQTAVGLFPIACAGIDPEEILNGSKKAKEDFTNPDLKTNEAYKYAVIRHHLYKEEKKNVEFFVTYSPSFVQIGEWWKQLFGESEGKDGLGLMPASVTFTTDLHSMGQYIQDGNKMFIETTLFMKHNPDVIEVPEDSQNLDGLNYLAGKNLEDINKKAFEGTIQAHSESGNNDNLIIYMEEMNAFNLGYMFYFFELTCAMSAYLNGVNPFNQPGVEIYKKNMFHLLGKPGF